MSNRIFESLKKNRKFYGETQKQLAKFLGCSNTTISNYEKNIRQVPIDDLEKLSKHYRVTINDLIKGNGPDFVLKGFDYQAYYSNISIIFPILQPSSLLSEGNDLSFINAVNIHSKFFDMVEGLFDDEADESIYSEDIDAEKCRENYLRAIQKEKYNLYCKANLIGLYYVSAMWITSIKNVIDIPESMLILLSGDRNIGKKVNERWKKEKTIYDPAISGMHDKQFMEILDKYLNDLAKSNIDLFVDLSQYYKCWRYILNLVDNNSGDIENEKYGVQRMLDCSEQGNVFASILECILLDAVKVK